MKIQYSAQFQNQPIRTYQRTEDGVETRNLGDMMQVKSNHWKPRAVSEERFEDETNRLNDANLELIKHPKQNLLDRGDRVLPKDASVNPSHMVMGYVAADPVSLSFIAQMAEVGSVEGFEVLARCAPEESANLLEQLKSWPGSKNVTVVPSRGLQDVWTEDHGEFTTQGNLVLPPLVDQHTPFGVDAFLDRLARLHPEVNVAEVAPNVSSYNLEDAMSRYPRANFSYQGMVGQAGTQRGMLGSALALDVPEIKFSASYIEGGNFLPGTAQDGQPLAFVGRDSIAISQAVLARDLGKKPSESEVVERIARDYGLKAGQVHPVEQPADFHVDMAMTWTQPGQVLLNDSMGVLKIQKKWLKHKRDLDVQSNPEQKQEIDKRFKTELKVLGEKAAHHADLESLSERDLKAAGVDVYRLPGSFPHTSANEQMNFMNLRQGTNENGEKFAVMLGGSPEAEEMITRELLHEIPTGYSRIHYLDRKLTVPTLELWGGIKCRTKPVAVD
jgi:hypothetical protein